MTDRPIITTRPLETVPEFLAAVELQRAVWPGPDVDVVPLHLLVTIAHNGGLVLGAFHGQQIGYQLKLAQRDYVAFQGVRLITWTFDPLESRNARLNIAKLGAVCNKYMRVPYGDMDDALNAAVPADRFQVDWWITSPRVK